MTVTRQTPPATTVDDRAAIDRPVARNATAPGPAPQGRLLVFDTLRGLFVLLMAAGHLLRNLAPDAIAPPLLQFVQSALIGTVGFMTVSGMLAGYLLDRSPVRRTAIIRRYRQQAVKLLLIAHPLLLFALYGWKRAGGTPPDLVLRTWFITDTLAVIFVAVVPFIARLRPRIRLLLGVVLLVAGKLLYVLRPGSSGFALLLVDALAGADWRRQHVLYEDYPLLSITGIFIIGSWIGRQFLDAQQSGNLRSFVQSVRRLLPVPVLITTGCLVFWAALRQGPQTSLRAFLYPDLYLSTYPVYLAAVLVLACALLRQSSGKWESRVAVLGRNSLFTYVAQYFVMQMFPLLLGWRHHMTLPAAAAYYTGAIVFLHLLARTYEQLQGVRPNPRPSRLPPSPSPRP